MNRILSFSFFVLSGFSGEAAVLLQQTILRQSNQTHSGCPLPYGMRVARTVAGFNMVVMGDNDIVSSQIWHKGFWEIKSPQEMMPAAAMGTVTFPETGTMLDIGANIGYFSLLFANSGYNVIAVEPMTRNRQALEASLCLNPHLKSRIQVVSAALVAPDEVAGKRCIIKSTNAHMNVGNGFLTCGANVQPCGAGDANCEEVPVQTLSTTLAQLNPTSVDVVKMDIENYECQVFAGGEVLFTKYHPRILQVETMWGKTGQCVQDVASKYSYNAIKVGENTGMVAKRMFLF